MGEGRTRKSNAFEIPARRPIAEFNPLRSPPLISFDPGTTQNITFLSHAISFLAKLSTKSACQK